MSVLFLESEYRNRGSSFNIFFSLYPIRQLSLNFSIKQFSVEVSLPRLERNYPEIERNMKQTLRMTSPTHVSTHISDTCSNATKGKELTSSTNSANGV
jgi:hypothetical protein